MSDIEVISYAFKDPLECNLSYMPFINEGGLFIPTLNTYALGQKVLVDLMLPGKNESLRIEGKVVWITPRNALHHVLPGIGIQFTGANTKSVRSQIEAQLDPKIEVGGYTYGITGEVNKDKEK
jgi:type IV pilus assembly protein PilZ